MLSRSLIYRSFVNDILTIKKKGRKTYTITKTIHQQLNNNLEKKCYALL